MGVLEGIEAEGIEKKLLDEGDFQRVENVRWVAAGFGPVCVGSL